MADRRHVPALVVAVHLRVRVPGRLDRTHARARCTAAAPTVPTSPTRPTATTWCRSHAKLTADEWQFAKVGRKKGIYKKVGQERRRLAATGTPASCKDACIFLNRPDFPAGAGCALHLHAMNTGRHYSDFKPEVCWQLPAAPDRRRAGRRHRRSPRLTEFGREGWGEGGEDFAWWCTEAPEAFTATRAGVRSRWRRAAQDARQEALPAGRRAISTVVVASRRSRPSPTRPRCRSR